MALTAAMALLLLAAACSGDIQKAMECVKPVELQKAITLCLKEFYLGFRKNASLNCTANFGPSMVSCSSESIMKCFKAAGETTPPAVLQNVNELTNPTMAKMMCDQVAPFWIMPPTNCSNDYHVQSVQCWQPVSTMFKANKGDPKLCEAYEEEQNCSMVAVEAYCSAKQYTAFQTDFKFLSEKKYNPFCVANSNSNSASFSSPWPLLLLGALLLFTGLLVG